MSRPTPDLTQDAIPPARIDGLFVYPVKSCRGIAMESAVLHEEGLEDDRRWMIVDQHGQFLTQRECPEMARIVTGFAYSASGSKALKLSIADVGGHCAPGAPTIHIAAEAPGNPIRVIIWKFQGAAIDCGNDAARFLSEFLARPARLVRFDDREGRACNKAWTGEPGSKTRFSDGYPVLVMSSASLADLQTRLNIDTLPMERFRPNIVLSGLAPYEEDFVRTLCVPEANTDALTPDEAIVLRLVKPCPRCSIPRVDPWTGELASFDPTAELATYRHNEKAGGSVLGMNAIVAQGLGTKLKTGQLIEVNYDF